jgi:hypothetical protein
MLLRVLRPLSGSVDGVDLTKFEAEQVYRFTNGVASFLLAIAAAEPVEEGVEPAVWPASRRMFDGRRESSVSQPRWTGRDRRSNKR